MQELKNLFTQNEWNLVQDVVQNGKTCTWRELALKHNIKLVGTTAEQQKKAANDVYRKYLKKSKVQETPSKILIYDVETSRLEAQVWWPGKQYVGGNQITSEPRIITIAYKWLGSDKVEYLKWDKRQSDKKLVKKFLKVYNESDMVIGFNNDRFDNRWINARALKYNFDVNTHVKSFDIMKQAKRLFRLPSYSMNNIARFIGVETKMQHSGLEMWNAIQYGSKKEAKKAMKMMIDYNVQDIIVTEQVFLRVRKYMKSPIHIGVLEGKSKSTCPSCGSEKVKLHKTTCTAAGTIQRIIKCKEDNTTYKISNTQYLKEFQS